jgi:lipopolysaccharide/colanic/teichoic acid biosynthesis glycosyltransferase
MDIFISGAGLLALSPLLVLLTIIVKLTSPGPVFYRGNRVGRNGKPFEMLKFRSMVPDAEKLGGTSTSDDDNRITGIGKFMRRYKLDELPQLINVLSGEMSLVGPRPQVKHDVDKYTEEERAILSVRPGITDWASIRFANEGEILKGEPDPDEAYIRLIRPEKLRLCLEYVRRQSVATDIKILWMTFKRLLGRKVELP